MTDYSALGARAEALVGELAKFSAEPDRLVRLFLSPEHRKAADCVAQWMRAAGMEVSEDALGSVRGHYAASGGAAAPRLLFGSHLDTVVDAGRYDGPLGIVAAILAVDHFHRQGRRFPFALDVVAFGDEEGSRFPTSLSSSSALAGIFTPRFLDQVDRAGVGFVEALKKYGKDPADIPAAALKAGDALAYVEVHIEQGPVLEAENEPLGVVTAIAGQTREWVAVSGEAGHAGTVPMRLRRDPLAGAAEMMSALEAIAREAAGEGVVATVGQIAAKPGAANIIPGEVVFSVDLRAPADPPRHAALAAFATQAEAIAKRRGLSLAIKPFAEHVTTPCDEKLRAGLAAAIERLGHKPVSLASGAGHDGMSMAHLCPVAMVFVRCRGGISHSPKEYCSVDDMGSAIAALIGFIENFKA